MPYERLLREADQQGVDVYERPLAGRLKGLYADNTIIIKRNMTYREKGGILAEELGHHYTSTGNILDQKDIRSRKQEKRAKSWAYQRLVPLSQIVQAYHARVKGRHEIAEFLCVTEDFLQRSIERYQEKYGLYVIHDERYAIYFDPLSVVEMFDYP
ncbi:ImmA/IrrE family metallo-endopeptidase [Paenibacillus flagellatus]|uniref:ImmA/IrrE family metallo-endopeptidase n=1 Tax=Paenibacillus flagellatus TaxID=2211139 RepID=A0A2V5KXD4_9BACL|nr:ImmA/IrrE family metallo-endopeptidase [Paenibacillus flagellatus]PYI57057.1 ImmA/IrrE family metallo-endopeptidase [Paenibacillus flagellatus]